MPRGERHYSKRNPEKCVRGEQVGTSKLTELQVIGIMARSLQGGYQRQVAKEFGVSQGTVTRIFNFKMWRYLFEES